MQIEASAGIFSCPCVEQLARLCGIDLEETSSCTDVDERDKRMQLP